MQREPLGFVRAFRKRGVEPVFVEDSCLLNENIESLMDISHERPELIIQPETELSLLPWGLDKIDVPTACFHFDPYAYIHRRVRWAMLFDYVCLFHPGFEDAFRQAGHSNPVTIPHAVDAEFFTSTTADRSLDIGWVGRSGGSLYGTRRRILEKLAAEFRMNEWGRLHSYGELAQVYCTSKLVVNVGRDDYPIDVSLRFAEAMAAGSLFITLLPSEINQLGFQSGVHFVGVRSEAEIFESVRYYLSHEPERCRIAEEGREKVLREHTYDSRAEELLRTVRQNKGKLFAPARGWPEERVRLVRLDYYAACARLDYAYNELRHIARCDLRTALSGGVLVARGLANQVRGHLRQIVNFLKAMSVKQRGQTYSK